MKALTGRGLGALVGLIVLALTLLGSPAQAQDRLWVQIESLSELTNAEQRVRAYAQLVENVNGFRTDAGLYAIAVGPFDEAGATTVLQQLRTQGLVPRDSFVTDGALFATQFFPVGSTILTQGGTVAPSIEPVAEAEPEPEPEPIPEETPQQARQSEAQLDREGRDALQIALQWFGFYNSAIDGAFGPGTRGAMSDWQVDRGFEPTGVLTTRQRAQLLGEYQGELAALGMQTVTDDRAGIEIDLPLAMVEFSRYNFPFAQYDSLGDSGVQVLLISQPGDETTLFGLYEIMQTLEIVPLEGERNRGRDRFLLTGQSDSLRSHTEARLSGGAVKGFTLVWPPERDEQIERVLPMMQSSIGYLDGALDPAAVPEGIEEGVDMVSGLDVRQPDLVRSGFFVDPEGAVLTTTDIIGECAEILINNVYEADVSYSDAGLGLAVLQPRQRLAPLAFAELASGPGRLRSEIAVSAFPFEGALSAASMSFGRLAELQGVNGEDTIQRLELDTTDSEAGGPVFDFTGSVLGMILPGDTDGRALPQDVTLALRGDKLTDVLAQAGVTTSASERVAAMNRENLARLGADMTVTVSCWN